jgi:hypothetical protein
MVSFQSLPVHVDPNLLPIITIGKPRLDSAATVDELLNANHNTNHTFFTKEEEVGVGCVYYLACFDGPLTVRL